MRNLSGIYGQTDIEYKIKIAHMSPRKTDKAKQNHTRTGIPFLTIYRLFCEIGCDIRK